MKQLRFIKKLDKDIKFIVLVFVIWRVGLFAVLFLSLKYLPLAGKNFLGGGLENYLNNPWLFAWANFDGEHFLSIAQSGYKPLEQAFFPIYPGLMNILARPFGESMQVLTLVGFLISNLSFLLTLIFLLKLIKKDFTESIARLTVAVILLFPTSFYFGAVYSESLFLLLIVSSFYFARENKWLVSSIFGIASSATRVFGLLLLPSLLIDAGYTKQPLKRWFWIVLIPLGLISYMFVQWQLSGDPLAFYHLQKVVGPQHDSGITLIPQIYFRYIKILLTTPFSNPIYQTIILELVVGVLFLILPFIGFLKKIKWSYLMFALLSFSLPTIQGSFSSLPRYVIVLFPSFLCIAILLKNCPKFVKIIYLIISGIFLVVECSLYLRGYWVA